MSENTKASRCEEQANTSLDIGMVLFGGNGQTSGAMRISFSARVWPVWASFLAALLGGLMAGAAAKFADESSIPAVGHIGTNFAVWIVLVVLIAALSRSWQRAVLCAVAFLLAMVAAYYVVQMLLFGFFSPRLFLAWTAIGLFLAPPFAALTWYTRRTGWLAALAAAMPIGLLLAEAYSVRFHLQNPFNDNYKIQFAFNIVAAVALFLILSRNRAQRMRVLVLTPLVMLGAPIVLNYVWSVAGRLMQ